MWKFLILSAVSMSAIVSFGSCNVMLMGGGLAPFADVGGGVCLFFSGVAGWQAFIILVFQ